MTPPAGPGVEQFGYRQELNRSLGFTDLLVYGLIFMVPIAPFGIFGSVYTGSGGMVALAYVVGMVAMMFTALSYAQMVRAFPTAGSVYSYAGRGIAPPVGFLAGWVILLDYVLVPGLLYLVPAVAMNSLVPAAPVWAWLVLFVAVNTLVNYLGIEMTARVNRVMLVAELIILVIFLVIGVTALLNGKGAGFSWSPLYDADTFSWSVVFGAVSVAVLSFLGFDGIPLLSTLVDFGAMTAFLALHVAVVIHYVVRHGSRDWLRHLVVPVIGFLILLSVVFNAKVAAQVLGFVWLGIGLLVLVFLYATGRRPALAGLGTGTEKEES